MADERRRAIEALRQGAANAQSEYLRVRREDLLLALGPAEPVASAATDRRPTTDKQP